MIEETDEQRQARIDMAVTRQLERAIAKNLELAQENKKLRQQVVELTEKLASDFR